jgi:methylmalonyl-CoA/ethylmalonyl-CoA epimerase
MTDYALGTNVVMQVGIVVRDIEARARDWSRILGLPRPEIITTAPVEIAHTEYQGQPTPARAKLAFFRMGQVAVELIEPLGAPSTWQDQLDAHGDSIHHIAFQIEGMAEKLTYLASNGMPLMQRGDYTGGRYAYVDGAAQLGLVLELLENDRHE